MIEQPESIDPKVGALLENKGAEEAYNATVVHEENEMQEDAVHAVPFVRRTMLSATDFGAAGAVDLENLAMQFVGNLGPDPVPRTACGGIDLDAIETAKQAADAAKEATEKAAEAVKKAKVARLAKAVAETAEAAKAVAEAAEAVKKAKAARVIKQQAALIAKHAAKKKAAAIAKNIAIAKSTAKGSRSSSSSSSSSDAAAAQAAKTPIAKTATANKLNIDMKEPPQRGTPVREITSRGRPVTQTDRYGVNDASTVNAESKEAADNDEVSFQGFGSPQFPPRAIYEPGLQDTCNMPSTTPGDTQTPGGPEDGAEGNEDGYDVIDDSDIDVAESPDNATSPSSPTPDDEVIVEAD